jgi:hypothetical protein
MTESDLQTKIAEPSGRFTGDDLLTLCAISVLAATLADFLHEGIGHAAIALLTGAQSGILSTVAWSSSSDSRLVQAGGTLVNLVAGALLWLFLRMRRNATAHTRYFLLIACLFNLFDGTGYFFFSGITNFGDWAGVIKGLQPHWMWRTLLFLVGVGSYYGVVLLAGLGFAKYLGVSSKSPRLLRLTLVPYLTGIVAVGVSGIFNPIGIQYVWLSALPATAGGHSGMIWFRYYVPKSIVPSSVEAPIARSYSWVLTALAVLIVFVGILGRGVTLRR